MDHGHTNASNNMIEGEHSPKEYAKFAIIILVITLLAWFINGTSGWINYLQWFMGIFFVIFGSFKLIGYQMFTMMFAGYDIVAKRFKPYAFAYPFIELALGIFYLFNMGSFGRDFLALIIMGVGSIGVFQEIKKRSGIHCACLGNVIKLPLSTVSLVEDVGMGLMALVMLIYGYL